MSSLYLGKIGGKKGVYEVHAFTYKNPFRWLKVSEISDSGLFQKLLEVRYKILEEGRVIYCSAVQPDVKRKIESNPHDYREGTVHLVSLDWNGGIVCGQSFAIDIDERGLPMENRWKPNGYPQGVSLDLFREKYIRLNYGEQRNVKPWEMAESYRLFRIKSHEDNKPARLGMHTGAYHLLSREPNKKSETPTYLWVFDAIPPYFNLNRLLGSVLIEPAIENPPRLVSPSMKEIKIQGMNGDALFYKNEKISRNVKVPYPYKENDELRFEIRDVPFLDGVADIRRLEKAIRKSPVFLSPIKYEGFNWIDKIYLRMFSGIVGRRAFNDIDDNPVINYIYRLINTMARRLTSSKIWEFNEIGKIK
jgi:hypothetical protein